MTAISTLALFSPGRHLAEYSGFNNLMGFSNKKLPYIVRTFNFFAYDYPKNKEFSLVLNPFK
jgi:hypothetical protein